MDQHHKGLIGRGVPDDVWVRFETLKSRGFRDWGPHLLVTQEMVNRFHMMTGDQNPLHLPGPNDFFGGPIIPGLFELAHFPKLMPNWAEIFPIPGFAVMIKGVDVDFKRRVLIPATIRMRQRAEEIKVDQLGLSASFRFEIIDISEDRPATSGVIRARYAQPEK